MPAAASIAALLRSLALRGIYLARGLLADTWLGRTQLVADVRARLFELTAPDLSRPVTFRGADFYVDPDDRGYVPSMVAGYYERLELDIFGALTTQAHVLFDVGANIGVYSVLGCLGSGELTAHAFEPVRENQALLQRNVASHGLQSRITVYPVAVSERAGHASIYLGQSGNHSLEHDQGGGRREVEVITLDAFVAAHGVVPDLVKIDVEGHEMPVLAGAQKVLAEHSPTVFAEYTPRAHRDAAELLARLEDVFAHCFAVDEVAGRVMEVPARSLVGEKDFNLILTSRAEHADTVRRFVTR